MNTLLQDLRFAVRALRKRPGFTAVAALTLALGIGSNTAIFSVVNGILLRPFPYAEPERIVAIGTTHPTEPGEVLNVSYPDYETIREQTRSLDGVAAWDWNPYNLRGDEGALFVGGERVSAGYFDVIGIDAVLGRTFRPEEDRPGAAAVVVLSETLWRTEFGADAGVLGRTVRLDGTAHTVIGVVPDHAARVERVRLWVPLGLDAAQAPRGAYWLEAIGRLGPGATLEQANTELDAVAARLRADYPETNRDRGLTAQPLRASMTAEERPLLLLLLGAVGLVLLIACANVANLLLARTTARRQELAVRGALGASRGRVVRQLLTESAVLGALGTGLGLLVGMWSLEAMLSWIPVGIPAWVRFEPDLRVFGFAAATATAAIALFGLPPALHASKTDIQETLKRTAGATTGTRGTGRLRGGLVVAEVALSLTLLVAAGLMIRGLLNLSSVDPGFETADRVTATLSLPSATYGDDAARRAFAGELLREVGAVPGVESAGVVSRFPLGGSSNAHVFTVEGQTAEEQRRNPYVLTNSVSPSYVEAMGIPVLRGRAFSAADRAETRPVAIINRTMAERYWPDENPIGRRIKFGMPDHSGEWLEVVGVVGDVRHYALERRPSIQLYLPYEQSPTGRLSVVAHAAAAGPGVLDEIRSAVRTIDPDQALYDAMTLDTVVAEAMWQWRFLNRLFWIFAGLALLLAVVGIYGVVAYTVGRRTRELGVRIALGAHRREVVGLVLRQSLPLILGGIALGIPLALMLGRLLSGVLYGVRPVEPLALAGVTILLAAAALGACFLPARRAAAVDPMTALRTE